MVLRFIPSLGCLCARAPQGTWHRAGQLVLISGVANLALWAISSLPAHKIGCRRCLYSGQVRNPERLKTLQQVVDRWQIHSATVELWTTGSEWNSSAPLFMGCMDLSLLSCSQVSVQLLKINFISEPLVCLQYCTGTAKLHWIRSWVR